MFTKILIIFFFIFALSHLVIWTLVPSLTNKNLPLDTIEALAWGSNLDWGFSKHPPMSAFFPEVFYKIFGAQDWAYYLLFELSQHRALVGDLDDGRVGQLAADPASARWRWRW